MTRPHEPALDAAAKDEGCAVNEVKRCWIARRLAGDIQGTGSAHL